MVVDDQLDRLHQHLNLQMKTLNRQKAEQILVEINRLQLYKHAMIHLNNKSKEDHELLEEKIKKARVELNKRSHSYPKHITDIVQLLREQQQTKADDSTIIIDQIAYLDTLPSFEIVSATPTKKKTRTRPQTKQTSITDESYSKIRESALNILVTKLPFADMLNCQSRKFTKEKMIEVISSDEDLKELFKDVNLKTISKKDLCERILFFRSKKLS